MEKFISIQDLTKFVQSQDGDLKVWVSLDGTESVFEHVALLNVIKNRKWRTEVVVAGVASPIGFMSADKLTMEDGALLSVRAPFVCVHGGKKAIMDAINSLADAEALMIEAYSSKRGVDMDAIRSSIADGEDHFFDARPAIKAGLADGVAAADGMSSEQLGALPELHEAVALWQEEDQPTSVTDTSGQVWMIGWYRGKMWKRKAHGGDGR